MSNDLIQGVVIGLVTQVDSESNEARVKLRFPSLGDDHQTDWVRIATAMAGANRGTYFLPEVDDEVLVAFERGQPRFPFVVGYLWNGKDKPPKEGINRKVRRMRTVSGHILEFDDNDGKERILIQTKGGHRLLLDDTSGQPKIELFDQQGRNGLKIDTTSNAIEITSQQGSITLKAPAGSIKLEAAQLDLKGTGPVTVEGKPINLN